MDTDFNLLGRVHESSKGRFSSFVDAVPDKVTVRSEPSFLFVCYRRDPDHPSNLFYETVFHEVNRVPIEEVLTEKLLNLKSVPIERKQVSFDSFAEVVFGVFMRVIEDYWIPDKFHLVLHSSGFDSRLISTAIKRLHEKNGDDWLGDVLFMEINRETDQFERIMEIEGWDESQYIAYNGDVDPKERHLRSFEFKNAWRRLNGVSCFPLNFWWETVEWLQDDGIAPEDMDLNCFTGLGSSPKFPVWVKGQSILDMWYRDRYACCVYSLPLKGNWIFPFLHIDYITALIKYGKGQTGFYRKALLDYYAPEIMEVEHYQGGYGSISDRLFNQVVNDYRSSWYGEEVRPDVEFINQIGYRKWWGFWCLASFCDHLLETEHEIEVG